MIGLRCVRGCVQMVALVAVVAGWSATVSAQPGGRSAPVTLEIGNTDANPVPTRSVDNPARQPYQARATVLLQVGEGSSQSTLPSPPPGKRLVVEAIYVSASLPAGQRAIAGLGQTDGSALIPLTFVGDFFGFDVYQAAQATRFWVSNSDPFIITCSHNSLIGTASCLFTVSGYLVDE
jgi:hypothetical protein